VRHGVSRDLATLLVEDMKRALEHLDKHATASPLTSEEAGGFSH